MKSPVFSIITACHNNREFLPDYFKSVLCQGSRVEIIFVDDCSSDKSAEYAEFLRDPRLKVIRLKKQMFCSHAYQEALKQAQSPIVGVVDADDVLEKDAVNSIINQYNKYGCDYIYTQHWWCDKKLKPKRLGLSRLPHLNKSFAEMAIEKKHCFSHWRTFKREIANPDVLFPTGLKYAVDKNLGFVLETCGLGAFYNIPMYYYRYYSGNMSKTFARAQADTCLSLAVKFKRQTHYPVKDIEVV